MDTSKTVAKHFGDSKTPAPKPELRVGQKWREKDKRFPYMPAREIVGFARDGFVLLRTTNGGLSRCDPKRFNGKFGGYELVEDVG